MTKGRRTHTVVEAIIAAIVVMLSSATTKGEDAPSFVGQWEGNWEKETKYQSNGGWKTRTIHDAYVLVIERVEGNQAYGHGETSWNDKKTPFRFQGVIEGNRLKFGKEVVTELEMTRDELHGQASTGSKILLVRKKP